MKVAFPYMGTTVIYKKLLELLGHEVVEPPEPTQRTIDLGVKYSPEFACFPLKVVLGSYIEALEMGAETLVTSGGHGPCRAGFYGEIHKKILKKMGYDVDIIVFDDYKRDIMGTINKVLRVKNGKPWRTVWKAIKTVYAMAKALDGIEKRIGRMRAYEINKGDCTKAWQKIKEKFDKVQTVEDVEKAEKESHQLLDGIALRPVPDSERIRIGIVGEIYVVMEQSINLRIEETLGSMGAEVERSQYISEWIDFHLKPGAAAKEHELNILKKGEKYIQEIIGGHAKQTVGHIVNFAERGFDGIVHLMPFACLPELISQSIIPTISKDYNIPVISLSIDEQTGAANVLTRLEAFMDLVRNNKISKTA